MIGLVLLAALSIVPPSVDFGPVLLDSYALASITLTNDGAAAITLGEITVDHADFDAGSRSGGLRPGTRLLPQESRPLEIAFRPRALGAASATLRIPSDDPASPEVLVPLAGIGALPSITTSPDSITLALAAGDSATRSLTISNTGDVPLAWSIALVPPTRSGDLNGVTILWDRSHGQQGSSFWSTLIGDLVARGATVTESTVPITAQVLQGVRILWSQDAGQAWTSSQLDALEAWVRAGGGLLIEGDNPSSIAVFNAIANRLAIGFLYASASGGQGLTTAVFPHPTTAGVARVDVQLHQAKLASIGGAAVELVRDVADAPVAVASRAGSGRIVALSDELLQNSVTVPGRENRLFGNQIIEWLTGTAWVAATPVSGSVPADSSRAVTLSFTTTELPAGTQRIDATISSNDPNRPVALVPVALTIAGRPDISATPSPLSFGTVVIGQSEIDTVTVWNAGEEDLAISSALASGSGFGASFVPATTLAPAETLLVPVTFSPVAVGPASGTLTITSDDPDEPQLAVPLTGSGQTDCSTGCVAPYVRAPQLAAANGFRFGMEIQLEANPSPVDAFVVDLEFDPAMLSFADSAAATPLTQDFVLVSAQEISPGVVRCAGFGSGSSAIPAGSSGALLRVFLEADCATCIPGDATNLVLANLTDDLAGMNACCGRFTFATCSNDGDVNHDGQLSPGDALCAIRIVLNGQVVTADCDVSGDCEVRSADVNCDSTVTAEDALAIYDRYLAGGPPYPCFAETGGPASEAARRAVKSMMQEARGEGAPPRADGIMPPPLRTSGGERVITFALASPAIRAKLFVVDLAGRLIQTLEDGPRGPGVFESHWNECNEAGRPVASGVYFVILEADDRRATAKLVLLREKVSSRRTGR